jgi:hypothetical protein
MALFINHCFVIVMGTDTMAYAATALSFMLENLGIPLFSGEVKFLSASQTQFDHGTYLC